MRLNLCLLLFSTILAALTSALPLRFARQVGSARGSGNAYGTYSSVRTNSHVLNSIEDLDAFIEGTATVTGTGKTHLNGEAQTGDRYSKYGVGGEVDGGALVSVGKSKVDKKDSSGGVSSTAVMTRTLNNRPGVAGTHGYVENQHGSISANSRTTGTGDSLTGSSQTNLVQKNEKKSGRTETSISCQGTGRCQTSSSSSLKLSCNPNSPKGCPRFIA